jgi:Predicted transcriptional regulator
MQESRLFRIVYFLLNRGQVTAAELAREFEVSVRTIYRDIDALSGAGIPVYAETGRNGGISLLDNYVLDRTLLSEKERQDILAALQSLSAAGNTCDKATLDKLSALFRLPSDNWYEVDFSRWGEVAQDNNKFEDLKKAVVCHRCVQISYVGAYTAESSRKIHPLKLLYKSRAWYVKAYCAEKKDFRLFKLNRIIRWELLEEEFIPVSWPEPSEEEKTPEQDQTPIVLRFSREVAYRVYDEFDLNHIQEQENGEMLVTAYMPQDGWLTGFLLSFGAQVEVISPAYLREVLAAQAREIYEKNRADA